MGSSLGAEVQLSKKTTSGKLHKTFSIRDEFGARFRECVMQFRKELSYCEYMEFVKGEGFPSPMNAALESLRY